METTMEEPLTLRRNSGINLVPSDLGLDLNGKEVKEIMAKKRRLYELLTSIVVFDRELKKGI